MDKFLLRPASSSQPQTGILAILQRMIDFLAWLAGLVQATEEEQEQAGLYLNRPGD